MSQTTTVKAKLKPPIFICGPSRSGTSLLRKILGNHPNIYAIEKETYLFVSENEPVGVMYKKLEKRGDIDSLTLTALSYMFCKTGDVLRFVPKKDYPQQILELFNEIKNLDEFKVVRNKFEIFNLCAAYFTRKNNKTRWVEKTPKNIVRVKEILKIYPDAKFIVTNRDPRAVYYSWKTRANDTSRPGLEYKGSLMWIIAANNREMLEKELKNNLYQIKYEDLVSAPEKEVKKLCDFLEEPYNPTMLDVYVVNTSFTDVRQQQGFKTTQIDRWKEGLKESEKILIDKVTKKFRKIYGYIDSNTKLNLLNFLSLIFLIIDILIKSTPVKIWIALYLKQTAKKLTNKQLNTYDIKTPKPDRRYNIDLLERSYALPLSKDKLVSVIIPCFNPKPNYFKAAMESILAQNYKNWEVIIINDGSNKMLFKQIKDYIENLNDKRISIITLNKNQGPSTARNKGIERAQGEIITFLDTDDIHFPWYYKEINDYFSNNSECLILASPSYKYIKTNKGNCIFLGDYEERLVKEPSSVAFQKLRFQKVLSAEDLKSYNLLAKKIGLKLFINATPRLACKKEVFNYISYDPNLRTAEDSDLCLQILNNEELLSKTEITLNPYYLHRMYFSKERLTQNPQLVFGNMIKLRAKYNDKTSIASKSLWFLERRDEWKFSAILFRYLKKKRNLLQTIQDILTISTGKKAKILNTLKILKLIVKYRLLIELAGIDPRIVNISKSGNVNKTSDIQVKFEEHLKSIEPFGSNDFASNIFKNIFNNK